MAHLLARPINTNFSRIFLHSYSPFLTLLTLSHTRNPFPPLNHTTLSPGEALQIAKSALAALNHQMSASDADADADTDITTAEQSTSSRGTGVGTSNHLREGMNDTL